MKDPQTAPEEAVRAFISRPDFSISPVPSRSGANSLVGLAVRIPLEAVALELRVLCAPVTQDYSLRAALSKSTKGRSAR